MAISINATNTATGDGSSVTFTKPTSSAGDVLLILVCVADTTSNQTCEVPTGYTLIGESGNNDSDSKAFACYRVCTGTEGSTVTVNFLTGSDYYVGWIISISGVDTEVSNVVGQSVLGTTPSGTTSYEISGFTTQQPNTEIFALWAYDGADATFSLSSNSGTAWPTSATDTLQSAGGAAGSSGGWVNATVSSESATGTFTVTSSLADGFSGILFTMVPLPINVVSGTVTLGGTPVSNVPVVVVYADDSSFTNTTFRRVALTDSNGDWYAHFPEGKTAFAMCMYDNSGTLYSSTSQGFITGV